MIKKQHKLTIAGYSAGVFIVIASTIRWFFLWYDPSQLVLALGIGCVVLGGSYVYQRLAEVSEQINGFQERLDNIGTIVSKLEWQKT